MENITATTQTLQGNYTGIKMADDDRLEPLYYQIFATIHLIFFILSLLLNSSAIITFTRDKDLLVPQNYILISLVVSDLLNTCLSMLVGAYANYQRWWTLNFKVCQMFAFTATCFGLVSIWHHVALALQRFVSFKFAMQCYINRRNMGSVIVFCWVIPAIYSSFPLFGWSSFALEPGFVGCSVKWYSTSLFDQSYVMTMFVFFFFVPLVVMVISYAGVHREMKSMSGKAAISWGRSSEQVNHTLLAQKKNAKLSFLMSSAFIVAWTPYAVVSLHVAFGGKIHPLGVILPAIFAKFSSCYNSIIFVFVYRRFRETFYNEVIRRFITSSNEIINYTRENIRRITQRNIKISETPSGTR